MRHIIKHTSPPLAAVGPAPLLAPLTAGRPQLYLLVLLFRGVGLSLRCCGIRGGSLLLLVLGGLEVVDDPIEEVLYVSIGLRRHLLVKLCLLLGHFLGRLPCFGQDLAFEVGFVPDYVHLDVLLAGLPDEVDPLGNVLC